MDALADDAWPTRTPADAQRTQRLPNFAEVCLLRWQSSSHRLGSIRPSPLPRPEPQREGASLPTRLAGPRLSWLPK